MRPGLSQVSGGVGSKEGQQRCAPNLGYLNPLANPTHLLYFAVHAALKDTSGLINPPLRYPVGQASADISVVAATSGDKELGEAA